MQTMQQIRRTAFRRELTSKARKTVLVVLFFLMILFLLIMFLHGLELVGPDVQLPYDPFEQG